MGLYKRGDTWWYSYSENGRQVRVSLGKKDKAAAEIAIGNIQKDLELGSEGVKTYGQTKRTEVGKLIDEYEERLIRLGRRPSHYLNQVRRLHRLLDEASSLETVTAQWIRETLARVSMLDPENLNTKIKGLTTLSPQTQNSYLVALGGFFNWLVREGRWAANPVKAIERAREGGVENPRRSLNPDEFERLLAVAPERRRVVYRVAATTGLRRKELRSLRWRDVDLDSAAIIVRSKIAKNWKDVHLPIPPSTVEALKTHKARQEKFGIGGSDEPVFRRGRRIEVASPRTIKEDLVKADVKVTDEFGKVDFHALRVTFGTTLARAGVELSLAQKLMRHCTPVLTANVYQRFQLHDARAAVEKAAKALEARPEKASKPRAERRAGR